MKQVAVGILVLVLAAAGTLALFSREAPAFVEPDASNRPQQVTAPAAVQVRGRVVPLHSVALNFPTKGLVPEVLVTEVLVQPGETVEQGDVLARLDTRDLQLRVEAARAALAQAQSNHERLLAGATPEEIAVAQAQLAQAQARARAIRGGVTAEDVTAAEADVASSRTDLDVQSNTRSAVLRTAQADLALARSRLQAAHDRLSSEKTSAQLRMEQAANELRTRQEAYSRVKWANQERGDKIDQFHIDLEAAALREVQDAETALQEAAVRYEQAKQAEIAGVAAAEAEVEVAQAALDALLANADAGEVAAINAAMAQAEADLAKLQGEQRAGALGAADAEEAIAQAVLQRMMAGPRPEDIAIATAEVREAEIALEREQLILEQAELRAPIAGTIVRMNLKVGEMATATDPGVVLADLSAWLIETEDLTEQHVVRLGEGDPVTITFDALPGLTLPGKVTRVEARGNSSFEGRPATYTVVITPDRLDTRLRWNMSAALSIAPRS
jgi:HlyD family secretion protein